MTTAQLGEIASIVRGIAFPKEDKSAEPLPGHVACLRTTNVQRTVEWEDLWFVPEKHVKREEQIVRSGDILISTANSYELVGKVAPVTGMPHKATLGAFISLIRPNERVDPKFLYHQLAWGKTQSRIRETASTTTNISNVSTKKLLTLEMFTPPLDEQREIVAELEKQFSRLDEAVANLQRVKANLKRYKASVLKDAVEGRLVPTEAELARREGRTFETGEQLLHAALLGRRIKWDRRGKYSEPKATDSDEFPILPEGWVWAKVEQLGFVRGGKRLPAGHKYTEESTRYPYIRVTDFNEYGVDTTSLKYLTSETRKEIQRYTISSDDVYISIAGSIGLVGVVPEALSGANLTENAAKITDLEHVDRKYLMYWLSSAKGVSAISDSTIATTQAKLALYRIENIPVPLPPLAEQVRIVGEVDRYLSIIREVEAEVDANLHRASALRQSTLRKAFETP